ncbi:heterotrimeric G protein alpha subunit [Flagelloscypha sp. PMI_526]|nr:heterotrimeric G protein alpha subunit [Flagelloscypha sp. PMI_526]
MGHSPPETPNPFLGEWPPRGQDETPAQRTARQTRELEAARISEKIDEDIRQHRIQLKKERDVVRVLLLGQAESGKSTTLKNFLMRYATEAWQRERSGWRAVVQLNVVRSIMTIISAVEAEMSGETPPEVEDDALDEEDQALSIEPVRFTEQHQLLMVRLSALRGVEGDLRRRLGAGSEPLQVSQTPLAATPFEGPVPPRRPQSDFLVRSWTDVLDPSHRGGLIPPTNGLEGVTLTIAACKDDMKALWEDKDVRQALRRRKLRLPDSAGFFLNELDRVAHRDYHVTDDDIVRARLRTVGIQEHRVRFKNGPWDTPKSARSSSSRDRSSDSAAPPGWEWRIYDVGGCRTSRQAWLPFFEDANCIIFLCPVSVFDERLEEDHRVNRLEDSIILWKSICSSKLLAKSQLVLFLNKCDLLKRKLKRGVKVSKYLTSYKDKNEVFPVVKYLQGKFKEIQKSLSPEPRTSYIFPTTVTDTQATAKTLETIRDGLLRSNLSQSQLI